MSVKDQVIAYYDQEANKYEELYEKSLLDQEFYPANAVRLEIVIDRLKARGARTVLDIGCGSGQPLLRMLNEGFDARGFDFSPKMVAAAQRALADSGHDPGRAMLADVENDASMPGGAFDAVVATGVFPHNIDDGAAYLNITRRMAARSFALIEYRNALMAMFSINKYSSSFFWHDLLREGEGLPGELRQATLDFFSKKFETSQQGVGHARAIEYSDILARFHNPLTLDSSLYEYGLRVVTKHFYHYHAAPPSLEKQYKEQFWKASLAMERTNDWRGIFLCSAFVAEIDRVW
jgi:SAM-dependent methyltransferase